MPKLDPREQRRAERAARRKRNTILASVAGVVLIALAVFVIITNLPGRVNADEVDTVFPLSKNAVKTSSGLVYDDIIVGDGPAAKAGDTVRIIYNGYLADGQAFASNAESPELFEFVLGTGAVIKGWDEGIVGMRVGGARLLVIPPELTIGAIDPFEAIPENTTLTYSITLKEIK